jgi:RND family efflux transporter MFP subunit
MKKLIYLLIATFIFLALLISCSSSKVDDNNALNEQVFNVKIKQVEIKEIDKFIEINSIVESWKKVHLVPSSPGKIEKILVDVGSVVQEGQLIAEMDPTQYQTTKLQLQQLEKDYRRMDSLVKIEAISKQQFEQFKTNYEVTKNSYSFIERNVFLKAPISGVVTARYYNEGEMFSAAPNTKDGKAAMVTIEQISTLKALIDIPESYFKLINNNMPVEMYFGMYPNQTFEAKVHQIYPTIDPLSKTFRVEIYIPNKNNLLRPGMFSVAKINVGKIKAMIVPSISVQKLQGTAKYYVFKNENNVARQVFVNREQIVDNYTVISSNDLKENDNIVVVGQEKLIDGAKIKVIQ